jgi:hypothetical protein
VAVGCLCGCTRQAPNPRSTDRQAKEDRAAEPSIVGKWQAVSGEGMELASDGSLHFTGANKPKRQGKYKLLEKDVLEVDLSPAVAKPFKAKVTITAQELTFVAQLPAKDSFRPNAVENRCSVWKRVSTKDAGPGDPPARSDDKLVGHWQGTANKKEVYDFFADGTFAHYRPGGILDDVNQGKWKASREAAAYLDLTYPDSGRTTPVFAILAGGKLVIGQDHSACPVAILRDTRTFERKGQPSAQMKPIQEGVLTAYQLHQEFKANPAEAERKYKDKEVQIAGIVQSIMSGGTSFHMTSKDKSVSKDTTGTTLTLTTGEKENVLCVFPGLQVKLFDKSGKGTLNRGKFVVLKGKCVGWAKQGGGLMQIGGSGPKITFEGCKVVEQQVDKTRGDKKQGEKK